MNENEKIYQIALTQLKGVGFRNAQKIIHKTPHLQQFFSCSKSDLSQLLGIQPSVANSLHLQFSQALDIAQKELEFCHQHNIQPLFFTDDAYPARLLECSDAPLLLYTKGNFDANNGKFISIVGTRNATQYGKQQCQELVADLATKIPDCVIVSGLAYGIDISAHKAALDAHLPTIAVLAGGLKRIYPREHHKYIGDILQNGGIMTEQLYHDFAERHFFLQRNRIIAGMADAVIVMESAAKGGALVTASIAGTYNKDVFVYPGRCNDAASAGCNALIKHNKAALIENADDLLQAMCWHTNTASTTPTTPSSIAHTSIFQNLSDEDKKIVICLEQYQHLHIDHLSELVAIKVEDLLPMLLLLEFQGIVVCLPGNRYQLIVKG